MTLILSYPRDLEAGLLDHWRQIGLLEMSCDAGTNRERSGDGDPTLAHFRLPNALETRLQELLDRQDAGILLTSEERVEAESLVELAEFLSLLHIRAMATASQS